MSFPIPQYEQGVFAVIKILVIEDEASHMTLIREAISDRDRMMNEVNNEQAAIDLMKAEDIDIVISDIRLNSPDSGIKILEAVMQLPSPPIVIMITGYGDIDTGPKVMSIGAFDYIEKRSRWTSKLATSVAKAVAILEGANRR